MKPVRQTSAVRRSSDRRCGQISYAHASLRFAFGGNVTLSTSTHRHYDESVHRIKQLTRGNNTIGFSDILSRIRNSTTTGSAVRVVYRGPFMSEDRSFDLSTALFRVTMYRQYARKVGTNANSALIRYYLPPLKLSIALLSRKRGNERLVFQINMSLTTINRHCEGIISNEGSC